MTHSSLSKYAGFQFKPHQEQRGSLILKNIPSSFTIHLVTLSCETAGLRKCEKCLGHPVERLLVRLTVSKSLHLEEWSWFPSLGSQLCVVHAGLEPSSMMTGALKGLDAQTCWILSAYFSSFSWRVVPACSFSPGRNCQSEPRSCERWSPPAPTHHHPRRHSNPKHSGGESKGGKKKKRRIHQQFSGKRISDTHRAALLPFCTYRWQFNTNGGHLFGLSCSQRLFLIWYSRTFAALLITWTWKKKSTTWD